MMMQLHILGIAVEHFISPLLLSLKRTVAGPDQQIQSLHVQMHIMFWTFGIKLSAPCSVQMELPVLPPLK